MAKKGFLKYRGPCKVGYRGYAGLGIYIYTCMYIHRLVDGIQGLRQVGCHLLGSYNEGSGAF